MNNNSSIIIKGNKHGITVLLDENKSFDELKGEIKETFERSAKFFGGADMALGVEGKKLTDEEQIELVDIITKVTSLNIICIIDNDDVKDAKFEQAIIKKKMEARIEQESDVKRLQPTSTNQGLFYKGTLRSGQILESESSIVVLGDVNPGAKIIAKGNVIVLGNLRGYIFAGAGGNENSFVVALDMNPMQIKIGGVIARSADEAPVSKKKKNINPKISYVYNGNIYVEDLTQENLEDVVIN